MTSLYDYESHLDSLDCRFYVRGSDVHVKFSKPFVISIEQCSSIDAILLMTRKVTAQLLDEQDLNIQYLIQQFIRFCSEFHGLKLDARAVADSIGLVEIFDVVYSRNENKRPGSLSLRFENGIGEYAGFHFIELERVSENGLQITRNMIGYGMNKQHVVVPKLDVVETDSSFLFLLPEPLSWQFEVQSSDYNWHWLQGTRIALHNSFSVDLRATVKTDLQSLTDGFPFEYVGNNTSIHLA